MNYYIYRPGNSHIFYIFYDYESKKGFQIDYDRNNDPDCEMIYNDSENSLEEWFKEDEKINVIKIQYIPKEVFSDVFKYIFNYTIKI